MIRKVFFHQHVAQGVADDLRAQLLPEVQLHCAEATPEPADYHILIDAFPNQERLEASPALQAVIIPFAGPPASTQALLRGYPQLSVHNAPYNAVPTAETALALMMAAAKFVVKADAALRQGDWRLRYGERPQLLLQGRTVLILGYGRIGRHMAPVCRALGMEVLGLRRTLQPEDAQDPHASVYSIAELPDLLPRADVLLIALPETPETVGLIDAAALARLPADALLVNVGRGAVVEEQALYEALRDGRLAAAGLDVWYRYPKDEAARSHTLPSSYPFQDLDNVVLSPHRAGWLGRNDASNMRFLATMLNAAARGEDLPHQIDLERGY